MATDALRWLQQVADGVTVTEVSEVDGVSQPGVSRALARLEREVGTPAAVTIGVGPARTQAGSAFKRHVDAQLHPLDDGLAAASQLVDPETGAVRLAFQTSLGTWLIPDLVRSFWAEHPQVQFQLTQVRDELVDSVLDRAEADLVISTLRSADPAARRQRLLDEPLRLAVPSDHRMAEATEVRLADAADDRFVMVRPSSLLRQACDDRARRERRFTGTWHRPGSLSEDHRCAATREIGLGWAADGRLLPAAELAGRPSLDRGPAPDAVE